jgi:hypothetical protein
MNKKNLVQSILLIAFTVFITYFFINPVLATQDDTFAEYMLGDGFSSATFKVTYFEYGFLFYEKAFVFLYHQFPNFNSLTAFYILLHALSGITIIYFLIEEKRRIINIFSIAVYLYLFFIPLLAKLSYTTVAGHCLVTCFFIFITLIIEKQKPSAEKLLFVLLLLVAALGLRMHMVLPLAAIVLPFCFLFKKNILGRWMIVLFGTILIVVCTFLLHQNDYKKNIPAWQNIKAVTNAQYHLGNYGFDEQKIDLEKDSFKKAAFKVISNNYLYDDTLLNADLLREMKTVVNVNVIGNKAEIYWLFTDIKQFLILIFAGILLIVFYITDKKLRNIIFLVNIMTIIVSAYLILYMKFPERIWQLIFLLLFLIVFYPLQQIKINVLSKPLKWFFCLSIIVIFFIQTIRIETIKKENKTGIENFISANKLLNSYPDYLFIEYNESYPFNNFPAFETPSKYPFDNILFPFFLNTELRLNTLKKFGFDNLNNALCVSNKIIVIGKPNAEFENYIFQTQNKKLVFKQTVLRPSCLPLYQVDSVK